MGDDQEEPLRDARVQLAAALQSAEAKVKRDMEEVLERAFMDRLRARLPKTTAWLGAEGFPTKGRRGEMALGALAELTLVLAPWEAPNE